MILEYKMVDFLFNTEATSVLNTKLTTSTQDIVPVAGVNRK